VRPTFVTQTQCPWKEGFATVFFPVGVFFLALTLNPSFGFFVQRSWNYENRPPTRSFRCFSPGIARGVCAWGDQRDYHGPGKGEGTGARRRVTVPGGAQRGMR